MTGTIKARSVPLCLHRSPRPVAAPRMPTFDQRVERALQNLCAYEARALCPRATFGAECQACDPLRVRDQARKRHSWPSGFRYRARSCEQPPKRNRVAAGLIFPSTRFGIGFDAQLTDKRRGLGVYPFSCHHCASGAFSQESIFPAFSSLETHQGECAVFIAWPGAGSPSAIGSLKNERAGNLPRRVLPKRLGEAR